MASESEKRIADDATRRYIYRIVGVWKTFAFTWSISSNGVEAISSQISL
jgi:hypothetical protein